MNQVSFNSLFSAKAPEKLNVSNKNSNSNTSIFTPAPSVETAGTVASSAPSGGSFSSVC